MGDSMRPGSVVFEYPPFNPDLHKRYDAQILKDLDFKRLRLTDEEVERIAEKVTAKVLQALELKELVAEVQRFMRAHP